MLFRCLLIFRIFWAYACPRESGCRGCARPKGWLGGGWLCGELLRCLIGWSGELLRSAVAAHGRREARVRGSCLRAPTAASSPGCPWAEPWASILVVFGCVVHELFFFGLQFHEFWCGQDCNPEFRAFWRWCLRLNLNYFNVAIRLAWRLRIRLAERC